MGASAVERAREAAGRAAWPEVYDLLRDRDEPELAAEDLQALADAAWWLSRVEESLAARHRAYAAYVATGDGRRAGYNAWMLSTEYSFLGKAAASAGWLRRAQRHLHDTGECVEQGWLAFGEAESAELRGDLDGALNAARRMTELGLRCDSRDLVALGLQTQGRLRIAQGRVAEGLALVDEAMCDVAAGALTDLAAGWAYCLAIAVCFQVADLRRAREWTDAAMEWCEARPAGTPFHGLCRVHHVELMALGGRWQEANAEASRACQELLAYDPGIAGESFYVAGEIRRRSGDLAGAEQAFVRAHELGRDPQPGLALLHLAQGEAETATAMLRSCLDAGGGNDLSRCRLLAAQVEAALAAGHLDSARAAAAQLDTVARASGAALLEAMAATAGGEVALGAQNLGEAAARLRQARTLWLELGLPYEAARTRVHLAAASRASGDHETARLELRAARSVFERLGSSADVGVVDELLEDEDRGLPCNLTRRELEVLRLVAAGMTNRDIAAELVVSHHTVARHLNNIFSKLGVSSRAAATAFAYDHDLIAATRA